jgi:hypothetical protein
VAKPTNLRDLAIALKRRGRTPEQEAARREVDKRNERMQGQGIPRGPNAHPDGTFGKVKT